MSVTAQTIATYVERAARLRARCAREISVEVAELTPLRFVHWLVEQKSNWSRSTWRSYKAAALYVLTHEDRPLDEGDGAIAILGAESQTGAVVRTKETSAMKAGRFRYQDRMRVYADLRLGRARYGRELIDFLRASCATGLRPLEWYAASLEIPEKGYNAKLVIHNAKTTNGRGNGARRTLRWRHLSPSMMRSIARTIGLARSFLSDDDYTKYYGRLQGCLQDVSRRLWPDKEQCYAIYCCRHEFIAQAKLVYAPAEVAALVGHHDDETAFTHYGRRDSTGVVDIELPIPDEAEVAQVRRTVATQLEALSKLHERDDTPVTSRSPADPQTVAEFEPFPTPPVTKKDEPAPDLSLWPNFYKMLHAPPTDSSSFGSRRERRDDTTSDIEPNENEQTGIKPP
ncbi:MAG TPA: hypothetical protein VIF40_10455 [Methylosinus sp.]|jgi:hypothetical protein|uniref:hypothetical protein n=1 Tax=Methylosinus sp. TaxID=427 RepID=UPI002F9246AD